MHESLPLFSFVIRCVILTAGLPETTRVRFRALESVYLEGGHRRTGNSRETSVDRQFVGNAAFRARLNRGSVWLSQGLWFLAEVTDSAGK
jgi:hypothetical protein